MLKHFLNLSILLLFFIACKKTDQEDTGQYPTATFDAHERGVLPNAAASYSLSTCKWDNCTISYFIENSTGQFSVQQEAQMFQSVFVEWANASGITFSKATDASVADIHIMFDAIDGPGDRLAYSYYPCASSGARAGNITLDQEEIWSLDAQNDDGTPYDLFTVVSHEIGHALGLEHSSIEESLMYADYSGSKRSLHQDDIMGIRSLYQCGQQNPNTPTTGTGSGSTGNGGGTPPSTAVQLDQGLVGKYIFEGNALDQSGLGHTGIVYGALQSTNRHDQTSAYHFNGYAYDDNPSRIEVPFCSGMSFSNEFSFAGWVKMDDASGMAQNGTKHYADVYQTLFAKNFFEGSSMAARVYCAGGTNRYLSITANGKEELVPLQIVDGVWMHIAFSYAPGLLKVYSNGVLTSCVSTTLDFASANDKPLLIGSCAKGVNTKNGLQKYWYPFNGNLDDLHFYNRALNAAEVLTLAL